MALRASYYGLKKRILDKVLGDYDVAGVMTNKELTEKKWNKNFVSIPSTADLNDYKETGCYYWGGTAPANTPESVTYGKLFVYNSPAALHQIVIRGNGYMAMRQFDGTEWKAWYKVTSTVIS